MGHSKLVEKEDVKRVCCFQRMVNSGTKARCPRAEWEMWSWRLTFLFGHIIQSFCQMNVHLSLTVFESCRAKNLICDDVEAACDPAKRQKPIAHSQDTELIFARVSAGFSMLVWSCQTYKLHVRALRPRWWKCWRNKTKISRVKDLFITSNTQAEYGKLEYRHRT